MDKSNIKAFIGTVIRLVITIVLAMTFFGIGYSGVGVIFCVLSLFQIIFIILTLKNMKK